MNAPPYRRGQGESKPYYVIDEKTGRIVQVKVRADAVAYEARPGVKAGNPLLDDVEKNIRLERVIEDGNPLLDEINKLLEDAGLLEHMRKLFLKKI